ncbi:MAG: DUF6917 domain-containing protein [Bacillota bacterium]
MPGIDPYLAGLFKTNPYAKKREIKGTLVVVLDGKLEGRNLKLITPISRALNKNEIHELIITDEPEAGPGKKVDTISYLGFFEVEQGSVMLSGDKLYLGNQLIGSIAGFDETHMPNHLNIVIKSNQRLTGVELNAEIGMEVIVNKH